MSRNLCASSHIALSLILTVELFAIGCAKTAPSQESAQAKTESVTETTNISTANAAKTPPALEKVENQSTEKPTASTVQNPAKTIARAKRTARPLDEAKFITPDAVGLVIVHPQQITESPLGRILNETQKQSGIFVDLSTSLAQMKLQLSDIDRAIFVFDQVAVNGVATRFGIAPIESPPKGSNLLVVKNLLKQIGLAFHNYHDVYLRFPRADGNGEGNQTGLSWRVHLLPFLEESALYEEFNLDEPWDSEHNKPLIAKMPRHFQTADVTDEGKTAFQVFVGEKTPFQGEKGTGIRDIVDGTSNTILVGKFKPEFAEIWTKPGGIDPSEINAKESLELFDDGHFFALMMDGAVGKIPADVDDDTMAKLIQHNDLTPININLHQNSAAPPIQPAIPPTIILTIGRDIDSKQMVATLIDEPKEITEGDQTIYQNKTKAITFPSARTAIVGHPDAVRKIVSKPQEPQERSPALIEQLQLAADVTYALDLQSQSAIIDRIVLMMPMLGMLSNVTTVSGQVSLDANAGEPLSEIQAIAVDEQMAAGLNAVATMALNGAKKTFEQQKLPAQANSSDQEMNEIIKQLVASSTLKAEGKKVRFAVPTPNEMPRIIELLKSGLQKD